MQENGRPDESDLAVVMIWLMTQMRPKRRRTKPSTWARKMNRQIKLPPAPEEAPRVTGFSRQIQEQDDFELEDEPVRRVRMQFGVPRSQIRRKSRGSVLVKGDSD